MMRKSLLGVLAAAAVAVTLGACGGPATGPATDRARHNDADVAFVQGMIPHHGQAVAMAALAGRQAGSEQVRTLATRIERAQGPEIAQMRGFLAAWGVPENAAGEMPGMNHGQAGGTAGIMTGAQMQQLGKARGAAFDRAFLEMMIEHHRGAVQMARTELATGQNREVRELAQTIVDAQQSEISEMQELPVPA